MARAVIIEDGVVINTVISSEEYAAYKGWVLSDTAQMGDLYNADDGTFESPEPEVYIDAGMLKDQLNQYHDAYCKNHVEHRGLMIAIDTEARINASETLASVKSGEQSLPFRWFSGDEYIEVESVDDMQSIRDAIFNGLQAGFRAKGAVLDQIDSAEDLEAFDVRKAWDEAMQS